MRLLTHFPVALVLGLAVPGPVRAASVTAPSVSAPLAEPVAVPTPPLAAPVAAPGAAPAAAPALPPQPGALPPPPAVTEAVKPAIRRGQVMFNFQDADIQAVVKTVSELTGRNFLLDPRVKGKITIISARPVSKAAAYDIFLSALTAQGFTAVPSPGGIVRILPVSEAKQHAIVSGRTPPAGGEQIITQVVPIQNGQAAQMVPLLRPLMSPTSQLSAYAPANALIITDYADNVRRLLAVIGRLDQPVSTDVTVVPLRYASAADLADLLSRLTATRPNVPGIPMPPGQEGATQVSVIPDLRTNSLLLRSDNPGRVAQLRALIEKLDVPARVMGNTRVVYLRNADATKLAKILRDLLAGGKGQAARTPGAAGGGEESATIEADEATNALIISAPDAVYNNLRNVIAKLDVRRAEVYVEALIAEITSDKLNQLGFQWAGANAAGQGAYGGLINFPASGSGIVATAANPAATLAAAGGLSLAYLGPQFTLPDGTVVRGLGALAQALSQKNYANILSTPNLLTLDNAEAKIMVGQNVPFVTGSYAQATGTTGAPVNPFQTIERKDVGLSLKIKPQITEGGAIKLDIIEEVSSISPTQVQGAADLITNKRSLSTKVIVDDGHTVVLGGLIQDNVTSTEQGVPILSRIPLLGALFRYRKKERTKTNLMVFLRPIIVRSPADAEGFTAARYNYLDLQNFEQGPEWGPILKRFAPGQTPPQTTPAAPAEPGGQPQLLGPPNATQSGSKPDEHSGDAN